MYFSLIQAAYDESEMQIIRRHLIALAIDNIYPMPFCLSEMLFHKENCKGLFTVSVFKVFFK